MLHKLFLVTTAAAALCGAASAADLASKPAAVSVPPLPFSWTGFYAGATLGTAFTASRESGALSNIFPGDHLTSDGAGLLGGIEAGYNYQIGSLVFGIEADYSLSDASTRFNLFPSNGSVGNSQLRGLGSLRGRFGYAADRGLIYVTGGLAEGSVNSVYKEAGDPIPYVGHDGESSTRLGAIFGAGVEYAITSNWTVKAEGLYYGLASKTYPDLLGGEPAYVKGTDKPTGLIGRVGVNYLFAANPAVPTSTPAANWAGAYIGATAGGVMHASNLHGPDGSFFGTAQEALPSAGTGLIGGLELGYNYQVAAWVAGIEADFGLSSARASDAFIGNLFRTESQLQGLGTVRGRLGYAVDKALLYATGGVAIGSVRSYADFATGNDALVSRTRVGAVGGAGIEYAVTEHISLKGEGLYYQFADKSYSVATGGDPLTVTDKTSGLVTRLGVNYKF